VEAPLTVLAAGAYGTPALLQPSGLGEGVGERLWDHPGVGLGWKPRGTGGETFMSQVTLRAQQRRPRRALGHVRDDGRGRAGVVHSIG
jgi:hypothetical protein